MAVDLQQTDGAAACALAAYSNSGGRSVSGGTTGVADAQSGGTAGSTGDGLQIGNNESNVIMYGYACRIPTGYSDATGNWTINIDVTGANANVQLTEIYIERLNSGCTQQEEVGATTGLTDVFSGDITGKTVNQASSITWAAGDVAMVLLVCTNLAKGGQAFTITPSLLVVAPGTEAAATANPIEVVAPRQPRMEIW